ncbi:transposase [Malaciobacter marinus]|uniref:transposase n=1 Tax=Malaciobacter marinus TaxID=505249 RepID=UPI003B000E54
MNSGFLYTIKGSFMYKKLPHINLKEHYQFITFRTKDSINFYLKKLENDLSLSNHIKQYKIDNYLDNSSLGAYINGHFIDSVKDIILENQSNLYEVIILCIMPNHIHILIKQFDDIDKIIKCIKAKTALRLNAKLNKKGSFWQKGYYDKVIRDEKHFEKVYNYIYNNPIKAKLKDWERRVYSFYE